jgi:hypothetical protein
MVMQPEPSTRNAVDAGSPRREEEAFERVLDATRVSEGV